MSWSKVLSIRVTFSHLKNWYREVISPGRLIVRDILIVSCRMSLHPFETNGRPSPCSQFLTTKSRSFVRRRVDVLGWSLTLSSTEATLLADWLERNRPVTVKKAYNLTMDHQMAHPHEKLGLFHSFLLRFWIFCANRMPLTNFSY